MCWRLRWFTQSRSMIFELRTRFSLRTWIFQITSASQCFFFSQKTCFFLWSLSRGSSRTPERSKVKLFVRIDKSFQPLSFVAKNSTLHLAVVLHPSLHCWINYTFGNLKKYLSTAVLETLVDMQQCYLRFC